MSETKTPHEWAVATGRALPRRPDSARYTREHQAAEAMHGWHPEVHEHHAGAPLQISQDDYEAALEAAMAYPNKPAHAPAMSPHAPLFGKAAPKTTTRRSRLTGPDREDD